MLDETGFRRKTYDDLLQDMEIKARESFGADINTSARAFLGLLLRLFAWFLSLAWIILEKVYYSGYVSTATGVQLDRLAKLVGIRRRGATPASGSVTIIGTIGKVIPLGTELTGESEGSPIYQTTEEATIGAGGNITVPVEALESGTAFNVGANVLTQLVEPDTEFTSVNNTLTITNGQDREEDYEFRVRIIEAVAGGGTSNIQNDLLAVEGVRAATIFENDQNEEVGGMPPHSIRAVVLDGDDEAIGTALLGAKPAGIQTFGTESVTVKDMSGRDKVVKFDRAEEVDVILRLTITRNDAFPFDGEARVKTSLVQYIGGQDADGRLYAGLGMGGDVVFSRLIGTVYATPGVSDVIVETSTDGLIFTEPSITIDDSQVAQTSHDKIEVTLE
ncbi:baseplate J/gp47 family protein [Exiguobacterium sp. s181]|uniref:baseplate J/gp47 family protein n=1 Tax=Exiguobacterium sp. s181 TaxID=2751288 RepID=UPI001BE6CDE3|nr:baseplate J/gp47 family protein [Exiguobacterium sp. s181]